MLLLLVIWGCRDKPLPADAAVIVPQRSFSVQGKIVATDPGLGEVTVAHEAVPGFMDAMTMPYKLKDRNIIGELHPGDRINAKILATHDQTGFHNVVLDQIVITAQARPDYKPAKQYHVPEPGDVVPDFHLLDQDDRAVNLEQYRGKVLLLTFVYTRCPLADYCPRLSHNFATIDQLLASEPALYKQTHLLSISFDPAYDTPAVLRSYGGAYTGKYTTERFGHWTFAAMLPADLTTAEEFFDLGVTPPNDPADKQTLNHSLSTAIVGKDGKIVAWYRDNAWQPADFIPILRKAAAK